MAAVRCSAVLTGNDANLSRFPAANRSAISFLCLKLQQSTGTQFNRKKITPKITPKTAPKIASIFTIKKVSKMAVHTGVLFKIGFRCHFRCDFRCDFFSIKLGPRMP